MYKIRINCTSGTELLFNNAKINKKTYNNIQTKLQPDNINYINSIFILHKKIDSYNFTMKSLEFLCKEEITKLQFQDFILKMKKIGFHTNVNNYIQLIDNTGNVIFNLNFKTGEYTPNHNIKGKYTTKPQYTQQILYKKPKKQATL